MTYNIEKIMEQLQQPFPAEDIEWRVQSSGMANGKAWALIMPYVTSRAIQQRLDDTVGAHCWKNSLVPVKTDRGLSFIAGISIKVNDEWIEKFDGADETNFENFKGGISNAMKRAGVEWGIGRYLYKLDVQFADLKEDRTGHFKAKIDGKWFSYDFPNLPDWALPEGAKNPEKKTEKKPEEIIEKELGARNLTEEAQNCKTMEELGVWWNNLTPDQKKQAVGVKDERKKELYNAKKEEEVKEQTKQEDKKAPEGKYTIAGLRESTLKRLKEIAKEEGVENYSKMKKSDLINAILKKIYR